MTILKTTRFDTNILIADAIGTPAAPGAYFGFGQAGSAVASTGPRFQAVNASPDGTLVSPLGSLCIDTSTGTVYSNTDGASAWAAVGGGGTGGAWTTIPIAAPTTSVTINLPATGVDFELEAALRTDDPAASNEILMTANGDATAGNYDRQSIGGLSGATNADYSNTPGSLIGAGAGATANVFVFNKMRIPQFRSTDKHKFADISFIGQSAAGAVYAFKRTWTRRAASSGAVTDAFTSLVIGPSGGFSIIVGSSIRWRVTS